jgi:hypothetical protein
MCNNTLIQYVPNGWGHNAIRMRCGSTSIHGTTLYCDQCEDMFSRRGYSAHQCRHGKDMTREGSLCIACEFDDE